MKNFLEMVLPQTGVYYAAVFKQGTQYPIHISCDSIARLEHVLRDADSNGYETYFACAAYKEPFVMEYSDKLQKEIKRYRKRANVLGAKAFWLDIDVGPTKPYKTREEALAALVSFNRANKLPAPNVISSGYGFHVYYSLMQMVVPEIWTAVATRLKLLCEQHGFEVDPSRTSDITSILRPVGALNRKNKSAHTQVIQLLRNPPIPNEQFYAAVGVTAQVVDAAQQQVKHKSGASIIDNILSGRNYPPVDANRVAERCQQMSHLRDVKGNVAEPLWYAMLGVLAYSENSLAFANAWSSGHPQYNQAQTERKVEQWKTSTSGPTTCEAFARHNPSGCIGCTHTKDIKSPIQLGWIIQKLALPADAQQAKIPDPPYPYIRTPQGLMARQKEDDTGHIFFDYDLYATEILADPINGEQIILVFDKPHVGHVKLVAKAATFTKVDKTWEYCVSNGLYIRNETDAKHMANYIRGYAAQLQKLRVSIENYKSFGWKESGVFILGQYVISPDGTINTNPILKQQIPVATHIHPKGSMQPWIDLTAALGAPGMEAYAFTLLCGFAAPLFKFTGHGGVMVNLVGETGIGKSTMQRMVNSIWGDPDALMLAAKDTEASKLARLSYMNNLPVCIDEMGNMQAEALGALLLKVTQGMDTRRLRQDGTEREQREWNTIVITSSNHSFIGKLNTKKANSQAELMRLIEYKVQPTQLFMDKASATAVNRCIASNYGIVGAAYMSLLIKSQASIQTYIDDAYAEIKQQGFVFESKERFWEAALATALVAGRIAFSYGFIKFDPAAVVYTVCRMLLGQRSMMAEQTLLTEDLLSLFATTNLNKTLYLEIKKNSVPRYIREPRGDDLAIRVEVTLDSSGNMSKAHMILSIWHFNIFLAGLHEDYMSFKRDAQAKGFFVSENKRNLGEGTIYNTPQTKAITIDLLHPDLSAMFSTVQAPAPAGNVIPLRKVTK
jgi:hypothetical protein